MNRALAWLFAIAHALYAFDVFAAPGNQCSTDSHYSLGGDGNYLCWLVCDGLVQAGGDTSCQPSGGIDMSQCDPDTVKFSLGKAQASCEPGTISIWTSSSAVVAGANVWNRIGQITGRDEPLISSVPASAPQRNVRATFSPIVDAQCLDVDVIAECWKRK